MSVDDSSDGSGQETEDVGAGDSDSDLGSHRGLTGRGAKRGGSVPPASSTAKVREGGRARRKSGPSVQSMADVRAVSRASEVLRQLFSESDPDVEFGCFSAMYGSGQEEGRAVVQVDFGE